MRLTKVRFTVLGLVFMMPLLIGCSVPLETDDFEATLTRTVTPKAFIESTLTLTLEPSVTATRILSNETPGLTIEPTLKPTAKTTWTPVPTLSQEDKQVNLMELFSTNGGCDYPCWWGVKLGSPIQDALALSLRLGKAPYIYKSQYSYTIHLDELDLPDLDVVFFNKDEIIQRIMVTLQEPSRLTAYFGSLEKAFSLNSILNHYGRPTSVLLRITPRAEKDSSIRYTLLLIYELSGFAIEYDGKVNTEVPIQICPSLDDFHLEYISLYLQDAPAMSNLQRISLKQDYKAIETMTLMNLDEFFRFFSSAEEKACIETSLDYWR